MGEGSIRERYRGEGIGERKYRREEGVYTIQYIVESVIQYIHT